MSQFWPRIRPAPALSDIDDEGAAAADRLHGARQRREERQAPAAARRRALALAAQAPESRSASVRGAGGREGPMKAEWFAGRLRESREGKALSRGQPAALAGLKRGGARDLEQGLHSPTWKTLIALCRARGVTPDAFAKQPAALAPRSDEASDQ